MTTGVTASALMTALKRIAHARHKLVPPRFQPFALAACGLPLTVNSAALIAPNAAEKCRFAENLSRLRITPAAATAASMGLTAPGQVPPTGQAARSRLVGRRGTGVSICGTPEAHKPRRFDFFLYRSGWT